MTTTHTLSRPRDGQPALVEDIKRQARRLLKDVQSGHLLDLDRKEDFKLTKALELVARSHGFDTWGQMNAHLKGSTASKVLPAATSAAVDDASEVSFETVGDFAGKVLKFGYSEHEIRDRVCTARYADAEISREFHLAICRAIRALPSWSSFDDWKTPPRPPLTAEAMEYVLGAWRITPPGPEDEEARRIVTGHFLEESDERMLRAVAYPLGQFPGSDDLPDAPSSWATLSDPKRINPKVLEASLTGKDRDKADMSGYESCPHVAYICSDDDEARDIVARLKSATQEDWRPLDPAKIRRDGSWGSHTAIMDPLPDHIGREIKRGVDALDTLLMNYELTPQRACSLRAPLVVSLPWRPHDSRLPRLLPELRRNNILAVVRILPGCLEDYELRRLAEVMKHCHWHALAPGMCIPPKSGFERVMNRERRSLLLKREV